MRDLLKAVQYYHSKEIAHLNLNLTNILIMRQDPEHFFNDIDFGKEEEDKTEYISNESGRIDTPPNQKINSKEEN